METITVTHDGGYKLDELTVTDTSSDEIEVTRINDTRHTFTMPRGNVTVEATFVETEEEPDISALPFSNVASGAWSLSSGRLMRTLRADMATASMVSRTISPRSR